MTWVRPTRSPSRSHQRVSQREQECIVTLRSLSVISISTRRDPRQFGHVIAASPPFRETLQGHSHYRHKRPPALAREQYHGDGVEGGVGPDAGTESAGAHGQDTEDDPEGDEGGELQ